MARPRVPMNQLAIRIATPTGSAGTTPGAFGNPDAPSGGIDGAGTDTPTMMPGGDETCGSDTYTADPKTLEMYVLWDDSGSWDDADFTAAKQAFKDFVNDPASVGIGVALKYFGDSCDPAPVLNPDVPMDVLPNHAMQISASLDARQANGQTPTQGILEGALQYVSMRYMTQMNVRIVILLVTDGEPDPGDCDGTPYPNDIPDVAATAMKGFNANPSVPTYVLGVSGGQALNLDQIAQGGGTMMAIAAMTGNLVQKMNEVRDKEVAALPCEYALPAKYAEVNDPNLVNLQHNGMNVGRVDDPAACDMVMSDAVSSLPSS